VLDQAETIDFSLAEPGFRQNSDHSPTTASSIVRSFIACQPQAVLFSPKVHLLQTKAAERYHQAKSQAT
jgi:hypothetical protein